MLHRGQSKCIRNILGRSGDTVYEKSPLSRSEHERHLTSLDFLSPRNLSNSAVHASSWAEEPQNLDSHSDLSWGGFFMESTQTTVQKDHGCLLADLAPRRLTHGQRARCAHPAGPATQQAQQHNPRSNFRNEREECKVESCCWADAS